MRGLQWAAVGGATSNRGGRFRRWAAGFFFTPPHRAIAQRKGGSKLRTSGGSVGADPDRKDGLFAVGRSGSQEWLKEEGTFDSTAGKILNAPGGFASGNSKYYRWGGDR